MSAPVVWILFPGVAAGVLYALRRWDRAILVAGIAIALVLAWLAWVLPIGQPIALAPWPPLSSFQLADTLILYGRRIVLGNAIRPVLALTYLGIAMWFGGTSVARAGQLFIPLGLGIAVLFITALAVEPFLYAAILIVIAALLAVPILTPPGSQVRRGVLRFLTFQTLGMPFILIAGWLLPGISAETADAQTAGRAMILIGMGFAFFLAIFPFHTWIPMLAEESNPYSAAFVFFVVTGVVSLFTLEFLNRYEWLRSPAVYSTLRYAGLLMVGVGGVWAAFQRHLGRILAYAVINEIGLSLLALSLGMNGGQSGNAAASGIFFALLLPRGLGLAVWSQALTILKAQAGDLNFRSVQGMGRKMPVASASLIAANLSMAGFPLLAGFPIHIALWAGIAEQSWTAALGGLIGTIGLLAASVRTLAVLVSGGEKNWRVEENRRQIALMIAGCAILLLMGLLPQLFLPALTRMAAFFNP